MRNQISYTIYMLVHFSLIKLDIKAIGITNQRETTVLWSKETGKPLYNAISM